MNIIIKGEIKSISDEITKGSFTKKDLIVETEGQYPQIFAVEFGKEKAELLDFRAVGETVELHCNLRGREWVNPDGEKKYFTSIQCWKIVV